MVPICSSVFAGSKFGAKVYQSEFPNLSFQRVSTCSLAASSSEFQRSIQKILRETQRSASGHKKLPVVGLDYKSTIARPKTE
jgi:hypothetical protein